MRASLAAACAGASARESLSEKIAVYPKGSCQPHGKARVRACAEVTFESRSDICRAASETFGGGFGLTNPRLAFVAGPLKDSAVELGDAEVSIGRDSKNTVRVADALLSRRHCVVRRAGEGFVLVDLDSLNGAFVNGRPVREHALSHGDEITIGESRIVFLSGGDEADAQVSNPVELSDQRVTALTTVRLKVSDALAPPEGVEGKAQAFASLARDLTLLVKISTAINSVRGTDALRRELLRFVFEVVPAERGAILLLGEEGEMVSEFALEREGQSGDAVKVSRTVVRQVIEEGDAFLGNDLIEGS